MKKVISSIIAAVFIMSLAACGSSSDDNAQKPSESSGILAGAPGSEEVRHSEEQECTIDEAVLIDEAGVRITAKALDSAALFGPEVRLLIENDSGRDLTFQCRNASVNGYMVETMMSVDVVDGKKANDALTFTNSSLETCGISVIADMEFSFHIFTTEDWETFLDTPPIQLKTSAADIYEYTFDDSGDVVYEGNGIRIIIKGLDEDGSIFGPSVITYIENNSGENITVQTRDVSINGFMANAVFSSGVAAGKRAVDGITFMSSELEENGITAIEDVELSFHIFETDGWDTIVDTDVVEITF